MSDDCYLQTRLQPSINGQPRSRTVQLEYCPRIFSSDIFFHAGTLTLHDPQLGPMGESESRNDPARDFFYDVVVYRFEILALRCNRGLSAGTCLRRSEEIRDRSVV